MKKCLYILCFVLILQSCGKEDTAPALPQKPTVAKLVFPHENYLCNIGTNMTATESTVVFEWEESANTDSYELVLKNATTGITTSHQATGHKIPIVLDRGTPYIWYVISKSRAISDTAHSATWKFWNAGAEVQSYAPFPAEIIYPLMAARISTAASVITLEWKGSDVDNDIVGYDVYFDTATTPGKIKSDIKENALKDVPVKSNTVYYWKIITKDSKGNESESGIYQFKVL